MSTYFPTTESARSSRRWWLVDAAGVPLGRVASHVARLLSGKHKPEWTPHVDTGDHVVVINCEKVVLTGRKLDQKLYRRHSQHPGGLKEFEAHRVLRSHPERVLESAVRGMLPKTRLGRRMGRKLRVHVGPDHEHGAQRPQPYDLGIDVRERDA